MIVLGIVVLFYPTGRYANPGIASVGILAALIVGSQAAWPMAIRRGLGISWARASRLSIELVIVALPVFVITSLLFAFVVDRLLRS